MKIFDVLAAVILILGGLNWGLVGIFEFNLIAFIFSKSPWTARGIFILIGLCAVYQIYQWRAIQRRWSKF
ncbi:MAG TPA: DUF378 domain-containing protein [Rhabdochlamydiaceae bacterium]